MREMNLASVPTFESSTVVDKRDFNVLEIGCGVGLHPILYSKKHPLHRVFAVESTHERFEKFQRRLMAHSYLININAIHADARLWGAQHLASSSLDRVFILYPNPYPKKKHSNLRWHSMPFTKVLVDSIKVGGVLEFATNLKDYASEALEELLKKYPFELVSMVDLKTFPLSYVGDTHFERKYLQRGESCYRFSLKKV